MAELTLSSSLYAAMLAHVQAHFPEEACGLLAGRDGRAEQLYPIENIHHSPVVYEMDPLQQIRAMLAMEADGLEMLAIFHSHPHGPSQPSRSDVAQAYYPDAIQLIISLADRGRPDTRAYTIRDGQVGDATWQLESSRER